MPSRAPHRPGPGRRRRRAANAVHAAPRRPAAARRSSARCRRWQNPARSCPPSRAWEVSLIQPPFTPCDILDCHGRACPGHPRFWYIAKTWMPGTRPGMTVRMVLSMLLLKFAQITRLRFLAAAITATSASAQNLDKVSFGTNWVAEAEHGGFYQALADGTYRKYGLDVTIVPGGPQVNNRILVPVGKMDFVMIAGTLQSFDAVAQNIPTV